MQLQASTCGLRTKSLVIKTLRDKSKTTKEAVSMNAFHIFSFSGHKESRKVAIRSEVVASKIVTGEVTNQLKKILRDDIFFFIF